MPKQELFAEVKDTKEVKSVVPVISATSLKPGIKKEEVKNLILRCFLSPGDVVMLAYGIKSLKEQYSEYRVGVETSANEIFEGNPHIDRDLMAAYYDAKNKSAEIQSKIFYNQDGNQYADLDVKGEKLKARIINAGYDTTIHKSNQRPVMFVNAFGHELGTKLGIVIEPTEWIGSIYIRDEEKSWYSAVHEITGHDPAYFVLDAGYKTDFTAKAWDFKRYQEVVSRLPEITFVQIGVKHPDHIHPELHGDNLINLVGKTNHRQLIRLVYNAFGVITPCSYPMVLSTAVPPNPRYQRKSRALVVIYGGREPQHWQTQPNAQFLSTCGTLPCNDQGCWVSRVVPLGNKIDGKPDIKDSNTCVYPVKLENGQFIPRCTDMITTDDVVNAIKKYTDNLEYKE